jgi:hypothetical protein
MPKALETVKTTVRIPVALWTAAKIRAVEERRDFQDILIAALSAYLGQPSKKGGPR